MVFQFYPFLKCGINWVRIFLIKIMVTDSIYSQPDITIFFPFCFNRMPAVCNM